MTQRFRADLPAWIFIVGLTSFPWIIAWANSGLRVDRAGFAVAAAISGFAVIWLAFFQIVITSDELIFRSLFRGRHSIKHKEIKIVRLQWRFRAAKGPLRLVVEPRDSAKARVLEINAKPFAKAAIDAVLELGAGVAEADDGGLRDGVVLRTIRAAQQRSKN